VALTRRVCAGDVFDEEFKLYPDSWCLQATLTRDLALLDTAETGSGDFEDNQSSYDRPGSWGVAGVYDFLQFKQCSTLEELAEIEEPQSASHSTRLVLYPFQDERLRVDQSVVDLLCRRASGEDLDRFPILVFTSVSFTAAVYGKDGKQGSALKAILNMIKLWACFEESLECRQRSYFFGSLSNPDLVVVTLINNPHELRQLYSVVRRVECLKTSELDQCRLEGVHDDYDAGLELERPGHACMSVQPILSFSRSSTEQMVAKSFIDGESEAHFAVDFRLKVLNGYQAGEADATNAETINPYRSTRMLQCA